MIEVSGTATIRVNYIVNLDMTEEEFDNLTPREQNEMLDASIDWMDACRSGKMDDLDVDDVKELS